MEERFHTVVVGGGQAGLAAAYFLSRAGLDFLVLDGDRRTGDPWRRRWDSLRLFTPSKFDSLPGLRFPGSDFYFPTKDETADYLEGYAEKFRVPLRLNTAVDSVTRINESFLLNAGPDRFRAANVIVATGAYNRPVIPPFARELDPGIAQIHSRAYRKPDQLPEGNILVVGAGNSGGEIAIELARAGHTVWLSGRDVGRIPADVVGKVLGGKPYWFFLSRVLSIDTPVGRRVRRRALRTGTPLIRLTPREIADAGVARCPRVKDVVDGKPRLEDGSVLDVKGVVWATGFLPDFSWIRLPVFDERGLPLHERGVLPQEPGLYFLGLHFQSALTSALLGGVSADAREIVDEIRSKSNGHQMTAT